MLKGPVVSDNMDQQGFKDLSDEQRFNLMQFSEYPDSYRLRR